MYKTWLDVLPLAMFILGCTTFASAYQKGAYPAWGMVLSILLLAGAMTAGAYLSARFNRFGGWLFCAVSFIVLMAFSL